MEFRFVILGAANIASKFCKAVKLVPDCEVAAVASKSLEKAQRFAEAQDILGPMEIMRKCWKRKSRTALTLQ